MKKFFLIFFICLFSFHLNASEKYWSNEKTYPTNIRDAENFIFKQFQKITPSDAEFKYPRLQGIWYGQNLGFIGIFEEKYKSNKFKMFLIKSPKGYGMSQVPGYEDIYKTHKDHEGTLEATIEGFETFDTNDKTHNDYIINGKLWYLQDDGSYKYKNSKGRIEILSDGHFKWIEKNTNSEREDTFVQVSPWLKETLKTLDKSKKITDFEMETNGGLFIYFDTKVKNNIISDKFYNFDYSGTVTVGDIERGINDKKWDSIEAINCHAKGSGTGLPFHMYYIYTTSEMNITDSKLVKKNCNPMKISYSTYFHLKNRQYYWTGGIALSLIVIFFFLKIQRSQELAAHNKNNKNKFETYSEFKEYKKKIEDKESLKQAAKEEKERKAEETKLAREAKAEEIRIKAEERRLEKEEKRNEKTQFKEPEDDYDDSLMDKVKRLKRLYKNGTLSKAEFEKAKNKLLK